MIIRLKKLILAGMSSTVLSLGAAAQAVEIEYWQYFFDARVDAMEQLIDNFEAANPDITVTMTHFPYADYRTKVAAAGVEPPTNFEELMAAAAAMTKTDSAGNITQVGITAGMTAQDHHWWREGLIRQFGGEPYTDDYQSVNYNSDAGLSALEFYASLFTGDNPVSSIGFMDEPQAAFKAGRAGMHIDGSFRIGSLDKTRGLEWGVTELPANTDGERSNYSSYWVNAITTKAEGEKYDAAVKFMEYITSDEAMQIWLDVVGELPAKPSVGMTEANANDPIFGPFIRGLAYAHTTKFANESAQRQLMVEMIERMTLEGMSAKDSLATAAESEQKILDEYYK